MKDSGGGQELVPQALCQAGASIIPKGDPFPAGDPGWAAEQLGECLNPKMAFKCDNRLAQSKALPSPQADSHQNL